MQVSSAENQVLSKIPSLKPVQSTLECSFEFCFTHCQKFGLSDFCLPGSFHSIFVFHVVFSCKVTCITYSETNL